MFKTTAALDLLRGNWHAQDHCLHAVRAVTWTAPEGVCPSEGVLSCSRPLLHFLRLRTAIQGTDTPVTGLGPLDVLQPAMTAEARCRFLYLLNLLVPGPLGLVHLLAPREAADKVWLGTAGKPTVTFPLLGSLWLAIALASIPGLYRPLKFSPIMLIQIIYKMIFLPTTILPLVLAGRWSEFPLASTAVFASYLPILLFCAPWGYWLGREGAREDAERKKGE